MAIQPIQAQESPLKRILQVGGAIAGGVAGSPGGAAGIAKGAATGGGIGSFAGDLVTKAPPQTVESEGMARRIQTIDQNPLSQIQQAQAAVKSLPPDQFPEVRKAFESAMAIARQNQQLGRG